MRKYILLVLLLLCGSPAFAQEANEMVQEGNNYLYIKSTTKHCIYTKEF